jgi:sugar lactone lactonase YvrE
MTTDTGAGGSGSTPDLCPDGFPRGVAGKPHLVAQLSSQPEGVAACANGDVFASLPDEGKVVRVPLSGGSPETWTTLPGRKPLGMVCVDDVLYVVDFRSSDAAVMRITGQGDPGTPLPKIDNDPGYSALNAIVGVPGLGLYASDASSSLNGRIVFFAETSPGVFHASVAKSGIAFPNGVEFEPKTNTLDVALTLGSRVLSYPIGSNGSLGKPHASSSSVPVIDAIDGIARDENAALYVAHYLQGYITRSTDGAHVATVNTPRSLVFRGGTLLFTSATGLHAVDLGVCGAHS